jgi:dienelactone hydrolase
LSRRLVDPALCDDRLHSYAKQFETLGPVFAQRGWIFFAPDRQGQGPSASAGPYIVDEMDEAEKAGGPAARSATMVRLLETDHLNDQLAALSWLKKSPLVKTNRVAVAGNSFGGIQTILGQNVVNTVPQSTRPEPLKPGLLQRKSKHR